MIRPVQRWQPDGPVQAYQTFGVRSPLTTHWRAATCAEMEEIADDMRRRAPLIADLEARANHLAEADATGCAPWRVGWQSTVRGDDIDLLRQACRGEIDGRRRHARELTLPDGAVTFVFEAGTPCLKADLHRVRVDRAPLFLRRLGDWRADLGGQRVYDRGDQWAEDLHTVHDRQAERLRQG